MERFQLLKSLAGKLQPGDGTCYEMVAVQFWDSIEVAVLNEGFPDKLTFLNYGDRVGEFYHSTRGEGTNLWTIKAAKEMVDRFLGTWKEDSEDGISSR